VSKLFLQYIVPKNTQFVLMYGSLKNQYWLFAGLYANRNIDCSLYVLLNTWNLLKEPQMGNLWVFFLINFLAKYSIYPHLGLFKTIPQLCVCGYMQILTFLSNICNTKYLKSLKGAIIEQFLSICETYVFSKILYLCPFVALSDEIVTLFMVVCKYDHCLYIIYCLKFLKWLKWVTIGQFVSNPFFKDIL
jgi:hypothetical protein